MEVWQWMEGRNSRPSSGLRVFLKLEMKAIGSLRSSNATGGGVALAAFLGPDGMISTLEGCMARMVDVRIGEDNARVLALIPETELLRTDLTEFDWCERWNRLRVYRAPDESPEQVVASDRVEQILAKTLKEYLEDADPPAADNPSVVDEVFWQAFGGTDPEMTELTEGLELEIGGERELEAEERENLLTVVPTDWVPIILNSRPPLQYFDAEALRVPEATEGCWRRHPFPAGFGLGFVASVATVALSGLVVYLTNAQDTTGESWLRFWHHLGIGGFSDPATTFSSIMFDTGNTTASTSSNSTASSSTASSSTASSSTTSSSTTSSSTTSSTTTTAAPLDNALVSVLVKSRLLNANVNDVTTLISKSELAELTVGMEVCEKAAAV
ncbi:putative transmembrane protein, partial [Gregarina niphandrodes]